VTDKKTKKQLEDEIEVLKVENEQLRHKLQLLETRLGVSERRCACYRNNQTTHEKK
jgi:hypothetical protein